MKYTLTEDMHTGYDAIDIQHKELFNAVNDLLEACAKGDGRKNVSKTSKFLQDYVDKHFADEEQLQIKTQYPDYLVHKQFHQEYKKNLYQELIKLDEDNVSIAALAAVNKSIAKLISHIKSEDRKMAKFVQSKMN